MDRFIPNFTEQDYNLSAYTYELPEELIAQEPPKERGLSRLMVHDRRKGKRISAHFSELAAYLPPCLLVVNNSKVVPARIYGKRESGGRVEILLTTPLPHIAPIVNGNGSYSAQVAALLKSSKKVREGEKIYIDDDFSATLLQRGEYGQCTLSLCWKGSLAEKLRKNGVMPLPPYIKRPQNREDLARYQTVYAKEEKSGSIAAPTAGLHFTPEMKESLTQQGFSWAEVTLYVGYGTFSPVRCDDIRHHAMHSEYCEISEENARLIKQAQAKGQAITAVGTTAARTLEGIMAKQGDISAFSGWTDIFVYPGRPIRLVDHLLTNFHLPESTLLMLLAAFAGREAILKTYAKAVEERFRFFSYGDAMLVL